MSAGIDYAAQLGFNSDDITYMAQRFRNWAEGKGVTMASPAAYWRNWVLKDARDRDTSTAKAAREGQIGARVSRYAPKRDVGLENSRRVARALGVLPPLPDDFSGPTIEGMTIQ